LLTAAESSGFEVVVATDQEIPYQQNLPLRRIVILVLCAPKNQLADLKGDSNRVNAAWVWWHLSRIALRFEWLSANSKLSL
jgi:hypothetical protein